MKYQHLTIEEREQLQLLWWERKSMIAFQSICINEGNWEDFDHAENVVEKLEKQILAQEV